MARLTRKAKAVFGAKYLVKSKLSKDMIKQYKPYD